MIGGDPLSASVILGLECHLGGGEGQLLEGVHATRIAQMFYQSKLNIPV